MPKSSFTASLKTFRRRMIQISWQPQMLVLRGSLIELVDAFLLEAGDEFLEDDEVDTSVKPGNSPHNPLNMSGDVRTIATPMRVQPTQESVVMIAPGAEPVEARPSLVKLPEGTAPHVQMSQIDPDNQQIPGAPVMNVLPPGVTGAMAPTTGEVRMVIPGADPIRAMDDLSLTQPVT